MFNFARNNLQPTRHAAGNSAKARTVENRKRYIKRHIKYLAAAAIIARAVAFTLMGGGYIRTLAGPAVSLLDGDR